MKSTKLLIPLLIVAVVAVVAARRSEACCGQLVDIWQWAVDPDIIDPCAEEVAVIDGLIYEYYWAGNLETWPMGVTVTVTDEWDVYVAEFDATVTTDFMGQSYGVDDDGDGLIDEDPGWPTSGVDDDGDGRIDEDGGVPGDEYADYSFAGVWDATDDFGDMVPAGLYNLTITASAGGMGSATVYGQVVTTTEEPCCVEGAYVDIDPDTINKQRAGKPVTAHVMPPEGYMAADVTAGRVISIDGTPVDIAGMVLSPDEEGAVVKFPSAEVIEYLPMVPGGPSGHGQPGRVEDVEICIEVDLAGGMVSCAICDLVDVIDKGGK